jgi:NAD(P)-dependent dehydrogenase (short-subunit alcohol dehydrogenase family)
MADGVATRWKTRFVMQSRSLPERLGTVEEVSNFLAFLASDEASCINGVAIEVGVGSIV